MLESGRHDSSEKYKFKHIVFGMMGGLYFSHHFKPWMMRTWIYTNLICIVINMGTCIGYLVLMKDVDLSTTYYTLCLIDGILYSALFVPLITYYFRNELEVILKLNTNVRQNENVRQIKRQILRMMYCLLGLITLISLVHNLALLVVSDDEKYIQDVRSYNIPTPWIQQLKTKWQYIGNSIFYLIPVSLMACSSAASPLFVFLISGEFYHAASTLSARIRRFSNNSSNTFEMLTERFLKDNDKSNIKFIDFCQNIEEEREKLLEKLKAAVQDFQHLIRKIRVAKTYIEFHFTLSIIFTLSAELFVISTLYSPNMNTLQKVRAFLDLAVINLGWLCFTYAGRIFDDVGEMINTEVYNIPWYYLDSTRRKTFYIFLYLTQKSVRFHGFGTYPMGMPFFLQTVKLAYTYFNFLRTVSKN